MAAKKPGKSPVMASKPAVKKGIKQNPNPSKMVTMNPFAKSPTGTDPNAGKLGRPKPLKKANMAPMSLSDMGFIGRGRKGK